MLKVAFVGLGRVFQHYATHWTSILSNTSSSVFVAALCDPKEQARTAAKTLFPNATLYFSVDEMIENEKIDVAFVLTPSGDHYYTSVKLLNSNIHTITEKPPALLVDHYDRLVSIALRRNLYYGAVFQNRLNPAVKYIKSILKPSSIGRELVADISLMWSRSQAYYSDDWHGTWLNDGGVICQQAIHHIDTAIYLLGPLESVVSHATCLAHNLEAEDTHIALLKFRSGVLATLKATTALGPKDHYASFSVFGSSGYVLIDGVALNQVNSAITVSGKIPEDVCKQHSIDVPNGYGLSHIDFISQTLNDISGGSYSPLVPHEDVRNLLSTLHALYRSSFVSDLQACKWIPIDIGYNYPPLGH